jgi:hypothetical protein
LIFQISTTDIEKLEEAKLKAKFPMAGRPMSGHSVFLQKRLANRVIHLLIYEIFSDLRFAFHYSPVSDFYIVLAPKNKFSICTIDISDNSTVVHEI